MINPITVRLLKDAEPSNYMTQIEESIANGPPGAARLKKVPYTDDCGRQPIYMTVDLAKYPHIHMKALDAYNRAAWDAKVANRTESLAEQPFSKAGGPFIEYPFSAQGIETDCIADLYFTAGCESVTVNFQSNSPGMRNATTLQKKLKKDPRWLTIVQSDPRHVSSHNRVLGWLHDHYYLKSGGRITHGDMEMLVGVLKANYMIGPPRKASKSDLQRYQSADAVAQKILFWFRTKAQGGSTPEQRIKADSQWETGTPKPTLTGASEWDTSIEQISTDDSWGPTRPIKPTDNWF